MAAAPGESVVTGPPVSVGVVPSVPSVPGAPGVPGVPGGPGTPKPIVEIAWTVEPAEITSAEN